MSCPHFISSILVAVFFMLIPAFTNYAQDTVRLEFSAGACDSEKADPWDKSTLGIKEVAWLDKNTLKIRVLVSLNCASKVMKGDYEISNDRIVLKYIWDNPMKEGKEIVAHCMCAQELIYLFKNIEKKNYHYGVESKRRISP